MSLLTDMLAEPCEKMPKAHDCTRYVNLRPDAEDPDDRYCPPCRLRAAVAQEVVRPGFVEACGQVDMAARIGAFCLRPKGHVVGPHRDQFGREW